MFTREFCDQLPHDPLQAAASIVDAYFNFATSVTDADKINKHSDYVAAVSALKAYCAAHGIDKMVLTAPPEVGGDRQLYASAVTIWFGEARKNIQARMSERIAEESDNHYGALFKNDHIVELTDDEYRRIQDLIDQLRKFLYESSIFDDKHRGRLLARLEKLQSELHKTMANIDRFWGFMSDAGISLGKLGNDAKPLFDRAREIIEVLYGAQSRTAGLPSPAELPQLPDYSGDDATL